LVFRDVYFIPDKSNYNEDHATSKVTTRKEPGGAANVESSEHDDGGRIYFETKSIRSPTCNWFTWIIYQRQRWWKSSRGNILSLSERSPSHWANLKTNNVQSSGKRCKGQIFKNPKKDDVPERKTKKMSGFNNVKYILTQRTKKIKSPKFFPTKGLISQYTLYL
jgi:hypothetical protein